MTVTGAVLIALILVPMAWLVLRGGRATGRPAPQDEDTAPRQHGLPPLR
jgi:hypothetical protein